MRLVLVAVLLLLQQKTAEQLVQQLRSDQPTQREEALRELLKMGKAALPALEAAAQDKDEEVRLRARHALRVLNPSSSREALEYLQESILKAKTLRIVFEGETRLIKDEGDEFWTSFTGEVALKEGNRAFYSMKRGTGKSPPLHCLLISDGSTLYGGGADETTSRGTPGTLTSLLGTAVARMGTCATSQVAWSLYGAVPKAEDSQNVDETLRLLDFLPVADDGEARVLGYTLGSTRYSTIGKIRLWVDPKTYRPLKRSMTIVGRSTLILETYKEFVLNEELPESKFKIPNAK